MPAGAHLIERKLEMDSAMPAISHFYGILIRMFYGDHAPPHFHAYYGGEQATIDIEWLNVLYGGLPTLDDSRTPASSLSVCATP